LCQSDFTNHNGTGGKCTFQIFCDRERKKEEKAYASTLFYYLNTICSKALIIIVSANFGLSFSRLSTILPVFFGKF
jgi:hypothetical protein